MDWSGIACICYEIREIKKARKKIPGLICRWVSKYQEIKFPYTILKIIFSIKKKNQIYFMHIFFGAVDKE
jgi:hypothetical protein